MNRLVIIGNGFDLAHGLPTRYKDFIDDYWTSVTNTDYYDEFISFENPQNIEFKDIKCLDDIAEFIMQYDEEIKYSESEIYKEFGNNILTGVYPRNHILNYKNDFFKQINKQNSENWVDIENEYYRQLKLVVKDNLIGNPNDFERKNFEKGRKQRLEKLNKEFEQVKNRLEKYLNEKVVKKHNLNLGFNEAFNFHNVFFPDIFDNIKRAGWREDFSKEDKDYIDELVREENHGKVKLRFLNFNYTHTLLSYFGMDFNLYKDSAYFIHGELNSSKNKINFGFGDEMDEDYKLIENIDDNEYLKNFKSFQYLQNDTYKKLMDFVESEKFEVFIMGSSCGLSDRTLLNTIFEHENCRLIKVFYYQWKENGEKKDNFTELTQNISRHFNDKKLMRSKIVHKKPEHLMPKIQLPKI